MKGILFAGAYGIASLLTASAVGQVPPYWETEFNHPFDYQNPGTHPWKDFKPQVSPTYSPNCRFNAMHMSLIPWGERQGHVVMWDWQNYSSVPTTYKQRWSIYNPINSTFADGLLTFASR